MNQSQWLRRGKNRNGLKHTVRLLDLLRPRRLEGCLQAVHVSDVHGEGDVLAAVRRQKVHNVASIVLEESCALILMRGPLLNVLDRVSNHDPGHSIPLSSGPSVDPT